MGIYEEVSRTVSQGLLMGVAASQTHSNTVSKLKGTNYGSMRKSEIKQQQHNERANI